MAGRSERLGPLRERPFRLLWIAQATSAVGDAMTPVALTFAVLETTQRELGGARPPGV